MDIAPNFKELDFELPSVSWTSLPVLPASWVVGTSVNKDCSALRLADVLRHLGKKSSSDMSDHVALLQGWDHQLLRLGEIEGGVGPALVDAAVPLVVGPAFSTWWDWPPFDSLVAMARSAAFAARIARSVPTIPSVVWRHDSDLYRWADWLSVTGATAVAVDLGTLRPGYWEWRMRGIALLGRIFESSSVMPHLVANGPSTIARMTELKTRWPGGITFASQRPWMLAMNGRLLDSDLQEHPSEGDRSDLARANRGTFAAVAERVVWQAVTHGPLATRTA
jgi:hypothetical protein